MTNQFRRALLVAAAIALAMLGMLRHAWAQG
jgi:hypothetical protein